MTKKHFQALANMRYAGRYVHTIQPHEVGKNLLMLDGRVTIVTDFLGRVQVRDVGKQIWENAGMYSVENDEQVALRLGSKQSA